MSVLPGEGTYPILYGSVALQSGIRTLPAYQARPDVGGRFPAVMAVPDEGGILPWFKAMCRGLARHGFAVVAPDLSAPAIHDRPGPPPVERAVQVLGQAFDYMASRDTAWLDHDQLGLVAVGAGGPPAIRFAARPGVGALVLLYGLLDPALVGLSTPVLGLYGREGVRVSVDDVRASRSKVGEWVLYEGVGDAFLEDAASGYHGGASRDALERMRGFLTDRLAARVA